MKSFNLEGLAEARALMNTGREDVLDQLSDQMEDNTTRFAEKIHKKLGAERGNGNLHRAALKADTELLCECIELAYDHIIDTASGVIDAYNKMVKAKFASIDKLCPELKNKDYGCEVNCTDGATSNFVKITGIKDKE